MGLDAFDDVFERVGGVEVSDGLVEGAGLCAGEAVCEEFADVAGLKVAFVEAEGFRLGDGVGVDGVFEDLFGVPAGFDVEASHHGHVVVAGVGGLEAGVFSVGVDGDDGDVVFEEFFHEDAEGVAFPGSGFGEDAAVFLDEFVHVEVHGEFEASKAAQVGAVLVEVEHGSYLIGAGFLDGGLGFRGRVGDGEASLRVASADDLRVGDEGAFVVACFVGFALDLGDLREVGVVAVIDGNVRGSGQVGVLNAEGEPVRAHVPDDAADLAG